MLAKLACWPYSWPLILNSLYQISNQYCIIWVTNTSHSSQTSYSMNNIFPCHRNVLLFHRVVHPIVCLFSWIMLVLTDWYWIQRVVSSTCLIIGSVGLLTVTQSSNHCHAIQSLLCYCNCWLDDGGSVTLKKQPVLSRAKCIMGWKWLLWIVSD